MRRAEMCRSVSPRITLSATEPHLITHAYAPSPGAYHASQSFSADTLLFQVVCIRRLDASAYALRHRGIFNCAQIEYCQYLLQRLMTRAWEQRCRCKVMAPKPGCAPLHLSCVCIALRSLVSVSCLRCSVRFVSFPRPRFCLQ